MLMKVPESPGLWRTVNGQRSRGGDDYCVLHGDFRCPECEQDDMDLSNLEDWFGICEPDGGAA